MKPWKVHVKGERGLDWEISLVREDYALGFESWGWADEDISEPSACKKILVGFHQCCHSAGALLPSTFDVVLAHARLICDSLNRSEALPAAAKVPIPSGPAP